MKKIFIGIDFSKKTFDVTLIKQLGDSEDKAYAKFSNTQKDYGKFFRWCRSNAGEAKVDEWLICGENTGLYSNNLAEWAYKAGIDICIANALEIKNSIGMQRGKNDREDSEHIARYAIGQTANHKRMPLYRPLKKELKELKAILSERHQIDLARTKLQNSIQEKKAVLKDSAAIQYLYEQIMPVLDKLKETIRNLDKKMQAIIDACNDPSNESIKRNFYIATSIKGIALQNGVAMLVYSRNFTAFETANQMATFWGVAPFRKQSGTSVNGAPHVSGYSNHWLKGILTEAATCSIKWNDKLGKYYKRLIAAGKHEGVAINNVKSKMIHIVFTMVRNQQRYDENYDVKKNDKNEEDMTEC